MIYYYTATRSKTDFITTYLLRKYMFIDLEVLKVFMGKFLNIKFYQKSCMGIVWQYSNIPFVFDYVKCQASATFLTSRCESIILGKEGQCKYVELRYQ